MKQAPLIVTLGLLGALGGLDAATAQVAGSSTVGVDVVRANRVAPGWSARRSILGRTVYNAAGEKVGKVDDLIVDLDRNVSFLIVGVGGFVGIGRHDVAFSTTALRRQGERIVLIGASKDEVRALPRFDYAMDDARHDRFVASAEKDIGRAKQKILVLEHRTTQLTGTAKDRLDRDIVDLRQGQKEVEERLDAMKVAGVERWREFEAQIDLATARLRRTIDGARV